MDRPRVGTRKSFVDQLGRALNNELFRIAYMDRPRVGGIQRVEWCTRQTTRIALKHGVFPGLHIYIHIYGFSFFSLLSKSKIIENFLK